MKKTLSIAIAVTSLLLAISSCKSTSDAGHCDAYGSVNQVNNSDITSK